MKKKIIIYGVGDLLYRYQEYIPWCDVVAIVDSNPDKQNLLINGLRVGSPALIKAQNYDFIVIFTEKYFSEVRDILMGEYFVNAEKIVSLNYLINRDAFCSEEEAIFVKNLLKKADNQKIFTSDGNSLIKYFYNNNKLKNVVCCEVDNYKTQCEVLLLHDNFSEVIADVDLKVMNVESIIWFVSYSYKKEKHFENQLTLLSKYGKKSVYLFLDRAIYCFKKETQREGLDAEIFVVSHKDYNVVKNQCYKTIAVGNNKTFKCDVKDNDGENIAGLNDRINECTAIYWIWKHTTSSYVGLTHYRRYFYNDDTKQRENVISEKMMSHVFFGGYDMIVPEITRLKKSVFQNIEDAVGRELTECVLKEIRERLSEEYNKSLDFVLKGNSFYRCNMFITKREILNEYCEWLFSFILDVAEKVDVSEYSSRQKRVVGYFAEIMLTVWLLNHEYRLIEFPISDV